MIARSEIAELYLKALNELLFNIDEWIISYVNCGCPSQPCLVLRLLMVLILVWLTDWRRLPIHPHIKKVSKLMDSLCLRLHEKHLCGPPLIHLNSHMVR